MHNPTTWGNKAYICDPWSNKVYPARDYLSKLKNYYSAGDLRSGIARARIENFDQSRHLLSPVNMYNSDYIRESGSKEHLEKISDMFKTKSKVILKAVKNLENDLVKVAAKLQTKYAGESDKQAVINKIIENLRSVTKKIEASLNKETETIKNGLENKDNKVDYIKHRTDLERALGSHVKAYKQAIKINKEDSATLGKHNTTMDKFMRFFKIAPELERKTKKALQKSQKEIENIFNKKPK